MTYKEFNKWCNDRACDGYWGMNTVIFCIGVNEDMKKTPFWKKKKVWKEKYQEIAEQIVEQINAKIDDIMGETE